jgi:hypothetical protein
MSNKILLHILLGLFLWSSSLKAQQDNTLFFMHELPQANFVNPAVPSTCKWFIGFPVLSSVHANYSTTAFAFNDALTNRPLSDSLYFNPDRVVNNLKGKELITSDINLTLFTMGVHHKDYYFTFSLNEKATTYNMVPAEMVQLAWDGNHPFAGQNVKANGLRLNGNHYREFAFGASKDMNDRWRLGVRMKVLFGLGNVYTPGTKGNFFTDQNSYALNLMLDSKVRSSLPIDVTTDENGQVSEVNFREDVSIMSYLFNFSNVGAGLDFGFVHRRDDRTTISGSLLDLGTIFWSKDVTTFESQGSFAYSGTGTDSNFDDLSFNQMLDSLQQVFRPSPGSGGYLSPLVPKAYLGVTRNLNNHLNFGVLGRTELYNNRLHPSLSISVNTYAHEIVNASFSYTLQNGEYTNFGAGVGVKMKAVHWHLMSDNIAGLFNMANTRNVNIRFGLSLIPACSERIKPVSSIRALDCYYSPYKHTGKKKKRKR